MLHVNIFIILQAKKIIKMLRFISFGSGSCGNCYYIYNEKFGILIDVGIGIRKLKKHFMDYGLSMKNIRYILVTHDHADHVKAVGSLSNSLNLPVYTTSKIHEGIKRNYCVRKKINTCNIRIINPQETLNLESFDIDTFNVPHDSMENIGFKIRYGELLFCIMTDIGHVTDEMAQVISEADYLVIESNHDEEMLMKGPYPEYLKQRIRSGNGHISNRQCAQALKGNATEKLKKVWLCHLSQENNHPELARKTVEMELSDTVPFKGNNLTIEVLKRSSPSGIFELSE